MIIFLNGWSGSGKDTIGSILVEQHGFKRIAFADFVKEQVADKLQIPVAECFSEVGKRKIYGKNTLREHLIEHGEGCKKAFGNGFWAQKLLEARLSEDPIVITDWRHLEELLEIQKTYPQRKLVPVHVRRPSQLVSPVPDKTEYSLLGFPFAHTISNDKRIKDLESKVNALLASFSA
jgi:hypothetical protein